MKEKIVAYMAELEKSMAEFMTRPVSYKSAVAVCEMAGCWHRLHEMAEALEKRG